MAVIIGKKMLNDTGQYEDYAIGITLPIQIGNNAFNQAFTTIEQAKSNIKNLLLTNRGERVMQPEFGSGLRELLFNFNELCLFIKKILKIYCFKFTFSYIFKYDILI